MDKDKMIDKRVEAILKHQADLRAKGLPVPPSPLSRGEIEFHKQKWLESVEAEDRERRQDYLAIKARNEKMADKVEDYINEHKNLSLVEIATPMIKAFRDATAHHDEEAVAYNAVKISRLLDILIEYDKRRGDKNAK